MELSTAAMRAREVLRRLIEAQWPSGRQRWAFLESLSEADIYRLLADEALREIVAGLGPGWAGASNDLFNASVTLAQRDVQETYEIAQREDRVRDFFEHNQI